MTAPAEPVVGIHPHKAAALLEALRRTSTAVYTAALDALGGLVDGLEDAEPVRTLLDTTDWLDGQARLLRDVLDEVWRDEVTGARSVDAPAVWTGSYVGAFDDPVAASRAADEALALVAVLTDDAGEDDLDRLRELLDRWRDDPVFAARVGRALDAAAVASLLESAEELHAAVPTDAARVARRRAIDSYLAVAATGSRYEVLPWSFDDVRAAVACDRGERDGVLTPGARGALAMLIAPDATWSDAVLVAAVEQIVVPANRAAHDEHQLQIGSAGDDPRARVLAGVARNPVAAARVLSEVAPDDLLAEDRTYDDGGVALGAVLVAGTRPGGDRADRAMRGLVDWLAAGHRLPLLAVDRLGEVAAPYLGALRDPALDADASVANPLPGLSDGARRALLTEVARRARAATDLRAAELVWAHGRIDALAGAGFDGGGIAVVASVDGRVSKLWDAHVLEEAKRADDHDEQVRRGWALVLSLIASSVRVPMLSAATGVAMQKVLDEALPPPHRSADATDDALVRRPADLQLFEHLVLATLWEHRADNHAFDAVPLPPALVEGEPPRLRPYVELNAAAREQLQAWRADPRVKAATHWQEVAVWGEQ